MAAARFWGMTGKGFDEHDVEDKAEMIAFHQVQNLVESWYYEQAERGVEKKDTAAARNITRT